MKTRFVAFTLGALLVAGGMMAQDNSKFGSDPDACRRNYSMYKEFYKQKNYKDALGPWQKTIEICPMFSYSVWSDGEKMFKGRIKDEQDLVKQAGLIDSLMWIYDQRIVYFGTNPRYPKGYILGNKGVSLLKYRKEEVKQGYDILKESLQLQKDLSQAPVCLTFMGASRQLFMDGIILAPQVLQDYELVMDIVDANLKKAPNDKNFSLAKDGIETHFTKSGAADCDALVALYQAQFEANKSDHDWLKKISRQLRKAGCTDSELFIATAEAMYAVQPDAEAGHNLAAMFLRQEEFDKAAEYLEKAIEICEDSGELGDMYYELAYITYSYYKEYRAARQLALQAIEARPNWGDPYILVGQIYIAAREEVFTDDFDQTTVFWAAIDKFAKAKQVDPEVADKATDLINTYSKYFPNNELVFFNTLKEGDPYKIGGWINETTKVRSRKL